MASGPLAPFPRPLWAGLLGLFVIYHVVVAPLKAGRYAAYHAAAGWVFPPGGGFCGICSEAGLVRFPACRPDRFVLSFTTKDTKDTKVKTYLGFSLVSLVSLW